MFETATGIRARQQIAYPHAIPTQAPAHVGQDPRTQLFNLYKSFLSTVVNTNSPHLMVNSILNENLYNTGKGGRHDQYIHHGRRIADLSMGELQYPWAAADADRKNECDLINFDRRAASMTDPIISQRLWAVASFVRTLQQQTGVVPRIYFYKNMDGSVVSVTLVDEINEIKFACLVSESI